MCPILLETFWPYQVPASMSSGFFSSSKHILSDTCSSLTVMSASKTVVLKEWLKKGFRADVNYLNLNDIRVVHSWPFSSIFHPFLTSFLSSFSLHFTQKWNSESKRNGYENIYFWQNGTQIGTLTLLLQKVNWKMIIFHGFGTVPGEKNAFSHHFSKFSFPECSR